ncbi:MAG: DUF5076 domain-containing protein [Rhodospirillaceae bacterium]
MSEPATGEMPPPAVAKSPTAFEVMRVWAEPNTEQHFVIRTTWDDPGAWGILLADVAREAAKAYAAQGHVEKEALRRIIALLNAELISPTGSAS